MVADPAGATSTATITDAGTVRGLTVNVAITHRFRGDLRVTLGHGDRTATLHDRTGGSADDLAFAVDLADGDGAVVAGEWRLHRVDAAAADVGQLVSWSLVAQVDGPAAAVRRPAGLLAGQLGWSPRPAWRASRASRSWRNFVARARHGRC